MQQGKPRFKIEVSPQYRTIMVNGVLGGYRPGFFEMLVFTDEIDPEELRAELSESLVVKRTFQCRLVLDPVQAKSLLVWLSQQVSEYEKKFGEIRLPARQQTEKRGPSMYV